MEAQLVPLGNEYIRLSLIPVIEIKIGADGVDIKIVLTNRRLGEGKRECRMTGGKDKLF